MAELAKKLRYSGPSGSGFCRIYNSTYGFPDASKYLRATIDGVNGYIPLVPTNSPIASPLKFYRYNDTYSLAVVCITPGSSQYGWGTTSASWTCPVNITRIRFTMGGTSYIFAVTPGRTYYLTNYTYVQRSGSKYVATLYGYNITFGNLDIASRHYNYHYENITEGEGEYLRVIGSYQAWDSNPTYTGFNPNVAGNAMKLEWSYEINQLGANYTP